LRTRRTSAKQLGLILDIHAHMQHVGAIKRPGREGKGESASHFVGDEFAKAEHPRESASDVNIFFRQVNTRNPATTVVGEIARSATKTTTDIQQVHTALDAELVGKVDRCRAP
jgi:hypothetical protein